MHYTWRKKTSLTAVPVVELTPEQRSERYRKAVKDWAERNPMNKYQVTFTNGKHAVVEAHRFVVDACQVTFYQATYASKMFSATDDDQVFWAPRGTVYHVALVRE